MNRSHHLRGDCSHRPPPHRDAFTAYTASFFVVLNVFHLYMVDIYEMCLYV